MSGRARRKGLLIALGLVCSCQMEPTVPEQGGQPLGGSTTPATAATVDAAGTLKLAAFHGTQFTLTIEGPVAQLEEGATIDLVAAQGWELSFTVLVPGGSGWPEPGDGENEDGAECWTEIDETGEEKTACRVPYFGYGDYTPTTLAIVSGQDEAQALMHVHKLGSQAGDEIRIDLLFSVLHPDEEASCRVYHAFTKEPLSFTLDEIEVLPEGLSLGLDHPILPFQSNGETDGPQPDPSSDCHLSEFSLPYSQQCPLPHAVPTNGVVEGTTFWHQRCVAAASVPE